MKISLIFVAFSEYMNFITQTIQSGEFEKEGPLFFQVFGQNFFRGADGSRILEEI